MGLMDEIKAETTCRPEKRWQLFHKTMAELGNKKEQDELLAALDNPAIPISAIFSVLRKRNIGVSQDTLRRWRNDRKS
jgi:hypothetical protein